jgi:MFS transporter, OPA family, glycerol-3-phosphate transporter
MSELITATRAEPVRPSAVPVVDLHRMRRAQWRMLFALMFVYLFYYTGRQNFGWALSRMQEDLGLSMAQLGWISFAMLMTYGVGQFINGNLGDKFGGRTMMTLGGLLSAGFNWLTSFGTSFWTLVGPWAANGYAQSMGWAPGSRMLSNWWPHAKRGKAFGWYVFAAGCSSILIFALGAAITAMHLSWEWVFRLPVLLLAGACVVFYFVARNKPEDLGYPPVEDDPRYADPRENGVAESSLRRYAEVLRNWRFLLGSLSIGFESLARYGLIIWLPVHLMGPAYKEQPAGVWIGIALPVGMAFGALSSGYISDRFFGANRSRPIALLLAMASVVLLLFYALPPERIVVGMILLFLAGFLVYGPQSCYWALCPDLLGRYRAATAIGVMNMWAYFVAAVTDPFIGWVIDQYGTSPLFLLLAASCVLGALVVLPIRR